MAEIKEREKLLEAKAEVITVVYNAIDTKLRSINEVMGIYMNDDLNRYSERVNELSLMYTTLQNLRESIEEDYFDHLDSVKRSNPED